MPSAMESMEESRRGPLCHPLLRETASATSRVPAGQHSAYLQRCIRLCCPGSLLGKQVVGMLAISKVVCNAGQDGLLDARGARQVAVEGAQSLQEASSEVQAVGKGGNGIYDDHLQIGNCVTRVCVAALHMQPRASTSENPLCSSRPGPWQGVSRLD